MQTEGYKNKKIMFKKIDSWWVVEALAYGVEGKSTKPTIGHISVLAISNYQVLAPWVVKMWLSWNIPLKVLSFWIWNAFPKLNSTLFRMHLVWKKITFRKILFISHQYFGVWLYKNIFRVKYFPLKGEKWLPSLFDDSYFSSQLSQFLTFYHCLNQHLNVIINTQNFIKILASFLLISIFNI